MAGQEVAKIVELAICDMVLGMPPFPFYLVLTVLDSVSRCRQLLVPIVPEWHAQHVLRHSICPVAAPAVSQDALTSTPGHQ
eukprot:4989956-Amphidinium_carterae.1